jgi:hypothetical protein
VTYRLIKFRTGHYALEADGKVIATVSRERPGGYWTAELIGSVAAQDQPKPFEEPRHRFEAFAKVREWLGWPEIVDPANPALPARWRRRRPAKLEAATPATGQAEAPRARSTYERLLRAWARASAAHRQRFLDTAGLKTKEPTSGCTDRPLPRVRHEAFARGVAAGLSASRAYALAYGRDTDGSTRASAVRLLANSTVQARIAEIKRHGAGVAQQSLGDLLPLLESRFRAAAQDGNFAEVINALKQIARMAGTR